MKNIFIKTLAGIALLLFIVFQIRGQLPVTGRPVPELAHIEPLVTSWMNAGNIDAAVIGIMRDGVVVYLRGFGWLDDDVPMIENAKVRLASVTKPITAAAIRNLIAEPDIDLALNTPAFNIGSNNGVLNLSPWPSLGDTRLANVTVNHLLNHWGGWARDSVGDHTIRECQIASEMNVTSPPGRTNTMRWILGQPLINNPGATYHYSNEGYLALGLIIEELQPISYLSYVRNRILRPGMGVPVTEISQARTLRGNADPREPWYRGGTCTFCNVFPGLVFGGCSNVLSIQRAYGQRHLEARLSQGGLIASAPAVLRFANTYRVGSQNIGMPLDEAPLTSQQAHGGSLEGVSTYLVQHPDGYNAFIFFNNRSDTTYVARRFWSVHLRDTLQGLNEDDWPTAASDGFWTQTSGSSSGGYGAYNQPYGSFSHALNQCTNGSNIRLLPGATQWSGLITTRLLIDAPEGNALIGQ